MAIYGKIVKSKKGNPGHLNHLTQREEWTSYQRLRRRESAIQAIEDTTRVLFPEWQRSCPNEDCEHREFIRLAGHPCKDCKYLVKPDRYDNKERSLAEGEIFMDNAKVSRGQLNKNQAVMTIEAALARRR